jgi:hypothetical protein
MRPERLLQYLYIYQNIAEQGVYFLIFLLASTCYRRCILCWLLVLYAYTHSVVKPKFTAAENVSLINNEGKL